MRRDVTPTRPTRAVAPDGADRPSAQEAAMLTPAGADAVDAAELILLRDLLQTVDTRVESVRRDLLETRHLLQEVARLSEQVLAQVRPPNPVRDDMEAVHAGVVSLLALSSLTFLDY